MKEWKKSLLAFLFGLVIILVVLEGVLNVVHLESDIFHRPDAVTGISLIPGKSGWYISRDYSNFKRVSAAGFVENEYAVKKPAGTYRIAVLGDSFVEALQVPLEKSFHKILEEKLNMIASGREAAASNSSYDNEPRSGELKGNLTAADQQLNVEVLNFGVSNFATVHEYIVLKSSVLKYSPDLVVLMFFPANDVAGNSDKIDTNGNRPYFETAAGGRLLKENGSLLIKPFVPINRSSVSELASNSKLVLFLYNNWKRFSIAQSESKNPPNLDYRYGANIFSVNQSVEWKEAWNTTVGILAEMKSLGESAGAQFLVFSIAHPTQIQPGFEPKYPVEAFNKNYPDELLEAILKKDKIQYLMSANAFSSAYAENKTPLYFQQDGHWTPKGHALAAELLFDEIQKLVIL